MWEEVPEAATPARLNTKPLCSAGKSRHVTELAGKGWSLVADAFPRPCPPLLPRRGTRTRRGDGGDLLRPLDNSTASMSTTGLPLTSARGSTAK